MENFWDIFKPQELIHFGGLALVLLIIFIENGLFFGFFLPGDSLLFTVGLLAYPSGTHPAVLDVELGWLIGAIGLAAIAGYYAGYYFGYRTGQTLYKKEDTLFFKKKYIYTAENFYRRYGGPALIIGRFLPIVRTFAPILAGVVRVKHKVFFVYNVIGAFLWPTVIVSSGYYVGSVFPNALNYLDYIVIGFIVVTAIPIINTLRKKKEPGSDQY